jgi:hypothetical protein
MLYADENLWEDLGTSGNATYDSDFENYTFFAYEPWTTGGGWLRTKTVHTLTVQTYGEKDYYTHTIKADYPIDIEILQGPAIPSINIDTAQDLYLQGTITSPRGDHPDR